MLHRTRYIAAAITAAAIVAPTAASAAQGEVVSEVVGITASSYHPAVLTCPKHAQVLVDTAGYSMCVKHPARGGLIVAPKRYPRCATGSLEALYTGSARTGAVRVFPAFRCFTA